MSSNETLDKILTRDCIAGMKRLPAGSVDLVFADPPYNIGFTYDAYHDRREADEYVNWCTDWMRQIHRVLKGDGSFWLAIGDDYCADLKVAAQREAGFFCRSWVIWYYTFGVNCKRKFSRSHTHLLYFVRDPKAFTFNHDAIRVPSARQLVYNDRRQNPSGRLPDDTWILRPQDLPEGFAPDSDTWYFPRVAGTFKERAGFHGCQMPEQLLGRIIKASSNAGETVLDPFAGSASTLVVARKLGRRYLGFELSAEYARKARSRLRKVQPGDPLEGAENPLTSALRTDDARHPTARNGKPAARRGRPPKKQPDAEATLF